MSKNEEDAWSHRRRQWSIIIGASVLGCVIRYQLIGWESFPW